MCGSAAAVSLTASWRPGPSATRSPRAKPRCCCSLLHLMAGPRARGASCRPARECLAGEIILDVMTAQGQASQKLYTALGLAPAPLGSRGGPARLLGALAVHASGLSAYGQIHLLWDDAPISAVFQLAQSVPDPEPTPGAAVRGFRMTIETERLTEDEHTALVELLAALQPLRQSQQSAERPDRVGAGDRMGDAGACEPACDSTPILADCAWQEQPGTRPIHFAGDEFSLLLTDRQPYDRNTPPDTLARIPPRTRRLRPTGRRCGSTLAPAARRPSRSGGSTTRPAAPRMSGARARRLAQPRWPSTRTKPHAKSAPRCGCPSRNGRWRSRPP